MLIAYLDESGLNSDGSMFIAGHIGNEENWLLFDEKWKAAMGARRSLHMTDLNWRNPEVKALLELLGPIPESCGLTRVLSSVKASDYADLIKGKSAAKILKPYNLALTGLVLNIARGVPDDEHVFLIFEEQPRYSYLARHIIPSVAAGPSALNSWGGIKVKKFTFIPNNGFARLDQADFFAHALMQLYRGPKSKRAEWTQSILGDMTGIGAILTKEQVRLIMEVGNSIVFPQDDDLGGSDAQSSRR
jgi:hypothetical protein